MSCTITKSPGIPIVRGVAEFKFACGGTVGTNYLSGPQVSEVVGMRILTIETIPASPGTPSAYNVSIVNSRGSTLATTGLRSVSATQIVEANRNTVGFYPVVTDNIGITVSALGIGNSTDVYLTFLKNL